MARGKLDDTIDLFRKLNEKAIKLLKARPLRIGNGHPVTTAWRKMRLHSRGEICLNATAWDWLSKLVVQLSRELKSFKYEEGRRTSVVERKRNTSTAAKAVTPKVQA